MTDAADAVAAAKKAVEEAEDALATAKAAAAEAAGAAAEAADSAADAVAAKGSADAAAASESLPEAPEGSVRPKALLTAKDVATIKAGYAFEGSVLELGALVNGIPDPDVQVRIPIGMLNRHGLVAGATGTGKTRTLQVLAEQLSAAGVPVFAADIKGDLTGVSTPGASSEKLLARTEGIAQEWSPGSFPTEYFSLGGVGMGYRFGPPALVSGRPCFPKFLTSMTRRSPPLGSCSTMRRKPGCLSWISQTCAQCSRGSRTRARVT